MSDDSEISPSEPPERGREAGQRNSGDESAQPEAPKQESRNRDAGQAGESAGEEVAVELVEGRVSRGRVAIPWLVILLLAGSIVSARNRTDQPAAEGETSLRLLEIQAKYFVGAAELPGMTGDQLYPQAQPLDSGPVIQRLGFVVLAGELSGPDEALKQLAALRNKLQDSPVEPSETEKALVGALRTLYVDYANDNWAAPSLTEADRARLRDELGWFGRLALAPKQAPGQELRREIIASARRLTAVVLVAFTGGVFATVLGFAVAVYFVVTWALGIVHSRLSAGSRYGAIYAETFAVWMILFTGLNIGVVITFGRDGELAPVAFVFLLSLIALGWPLLRDIPWHQFRRDVGWTAGRHPVVEVLLGVVCYVAALPFVLGALLATLLLFQFAGATGGDDFTSGGVPSHPILEWIAGAGLSQRLLVFFIACVAAPVVEETMFRGVLYRHLRDATAGWRTAASVALSVAINSFLFAAIHPQGALAVPVLMTLAAGFSLAREWRGSLLAPMTAHALNNGIMTLLLITLL